MFLIAGAALAAPAPVLEVGDARREVTLPLTGATFTYRYRQSIYDVPVREELRTVGDRIRIDRAYSPDLRALEYFRWPGAARSADGELEWTAPENASDGLDLVVAKDGDQTIDTGARRLALGSSFGEGARVRVRAAQRPLFLWLRALWP